MRKRWLLVGMVFLLVPWLLVGCGIPQEQYDAIVSDLGKAQQELQSTKTELEATVSTLEGNVATLETDLAESEATASTLEADLGTANSTISNLQADVRTQQTINSSLSTELKKVKDPRHFASFRELADWLYQDDTDEIYGDEAPLTAAYILQVRALRDGYLLPADIDVVDGNVISNSALIGDEIYWVIAQTDDIIFANYVTPVPPSHPLPLD